MQHQIACHSHFNFCQANFKNSNLHFFNLEKVNLQVCVYCTKSLQTEKLFKQALKSSEALLRSRAPLTNDGREETVHSKYSSNND